MGPILERHDGYDSDPRRKIGVDFNEQEALYRKHLLAATQDLRPNLLPLVGSMRWPVPLLGFQGTTLHYYEQGHPPSLTIETPPNTAVTSPVAAKVVRVDSADPSDSRERQVATIKLYAPDSRMTIILKDLVSTSLPDKLLDSVSLYGKTGVSVEAGEVLGQVGRIKFTMFPEDQTEFVDNRLGIMMAYQPRGPSEHFYHQDVVDPLPFFHQL